MIEWDVSRMYGMWIVTGTMIWRDRVYRHSHAVTEHGLNLYENNPQILINACQRTRNALLLGADIW